MLIDLSLCALHWNLFYMHSWSWQITCETLGKLYEVLKHVFHCSKQGWGHYAISHQPLLHWYAACKRAFKQTGRQAGPIKVHYLSCSIVHIWLDSSNGIDVCILSIWSWFCSLEFSERIAQQIMMVWMYIGGYIWYSLDKIYGICFFVGITFQTLLASCIDFQVILVDLHSFQISHK